MFGTPWPALVSVLGAAILGAVGPFLFKAGATRSASPLGFVLSPWIIAGLLCYLLVLGLFSYAFRRGGDVAVLYPLYATTFVWAAVLAIWLEGNPLRPGDVAGVILLLAGVYLMARGRPNPGV
ncbi:MAG: hypothetical protein AAF800_01965 [Planctomycetota bacterium]